MYLQQQLPPDFLDVAAPPSEVWNSKYKVCNEWLHDFFLKRQCIMSRVHVQNLLRQLQCRLAIFLVQSFTACMPLLTKISAFGLGRRRWSSVQQCYLYCPCTSSIYIYIYTPLGRNKEPLLWINLLICIVIWENLVLLLLFNIIDDVTYLISGIYTNLHTFQCKKCDVGYYVINHGVYRRRSCCRLVFIVNACRN